MADSETVRDLNEALRIMAELDKSADRAKASDMPLGPGDEGFINALKSHVAETRKVLKAVVERERGKSDPPAA